MATSAECQAWIEKLAPVVCKYAKQYGIYMAGFVIAQGCEESAWGTSSLARYQNNFFGIGGVGNWYSYSSFEEGCEGYFKHTVLAQSQAAKSATTFDEYAAAYVASRYGEVAAIEQLIRPIYNQWNLDQYNGSDGGGGSNKLEEFVQIALGYEGTTGAEWEAIWRNKNPKWVDPNLWCSEFVSACGEEAGIEGPGKAFIGGRSGLALVDGVEKCGGQIHTDDSYTPQRGDILLLNFDGRRLDQVTTSTDHTTLIYEYKDNRIYTIEGNAGDVVERHSYSRNAGIFAAFLTPNWSAVGGYASSSGAASGRFGVVGNLFDELNTRKDAILREAAYLEPVYESDKGKKVIKEYQAAAEVTDIKLSLANYTELFQAFWKAGVKTLGGSADISGEYDYSGLEPKVRTIVKFLVDKGLNNAAACGICGNIKFESGFRAEAIGDNGTSFGICQWHNERGAAMIRMAGITNWSNNLTGQLNYLWYELENNYSSVLTELKAVENTEEGAKKAADIFVRRFEIPANVDSESLKRQEAAAEYFNQIVPIVISGGGTWTITVNMANLTPLRRIIVTAAFECLEAGTPYVWGGESVQGGMDCSGLTQYCYKKAGIHITHYSEAQLNEAPHVGSVDQASIGDILHRSGHVGLYVGDGEVIEAIAGGSGNGPSNPGGPCSKNHSQYSFTHCLHWDI